MRHLEISAVAAFANELRQSVPAIVVALDAAEENPSDQQALSEAHRLFHALKGAASMVGLPALALLLNAAEELIEGPASGAAALSHQIRSVLASSLRVFMEYMDEAVAGRPVVPTAMSLAHTLLGRTGPWDPGAFRELIEVDTRELVAYVPTPEKPVLEEPRVAEEDSTPVAWSAPQEEASMAPQESPASPESPARQDVSLVREPHTEAPEPQAADAEENTHAAPEVQPSPAGTDLDLGPAEEIAPELAEVFAQEATEHLQSIARLTTRLLATPDDRDALQELRRTVHTLKGAAGVVGYQAAATLAHRMEDLLDRLYEDSATLTPDAARLLESSSDALDHAVNGTADPSGLRVTIARLFSEFDRAIGQLSGAPAAPAESPAPAQSPASPVEPERKREAVSIRDRRASEDRRSGGNTLRVPVRRLNDLVRAVSELVLSRSTLGQHYAELLAQMDELTFSAARIRKVAQKLESDYEVRALAGHVASGAHGFDELEFDRYTDFHLLTRELVETAADVTAVSTRLSDSVGDFDGDLTHLGRLTREIQDKTMEFRMVALGTMTTRIERIVRVAAALCGKDVDCAIESEEVSLDKSLLDHMADPLLHLLRNSVAHGIEMPDERRARGKPARGRITVGAYHDGTEVVIEVSDDGKGLDAERIRRTAVDRGLVTSADAGALPAEALFAFIFEPGFSTASQISEVSGRGVGLDVVKATVTKIGGRIQVDSRPGEGTTIAVRVPMTLAITRVLLVRAGGETFGLPLGAVLRIVRPHPTAIGRVGTQRVLTTDGRSYPLRDLIDALGLARSADAPAVPPVLIVNLAGRHVALAVDKILHSMDAVVKSLGSHLRRVRGVWGATLLGDGTVVLILNATDLAGFTEESPIRITARPARAVALQPLNVLVVDDSVSMRHVLSNTIKKAGWIPLQARDGLDALEVVHRAARAPDIILLDIEMPRMDGYEFLSTMRAQPAYADLPIVMLTSRGGEKHRAKATALGATDYLVKPFREEVLLATISRLARPGSHQERKAAS